LNSRTMAPAAVRARSESTWKDLFLATLVAEFIPLRNSCRQLSPPSIAYGRQRAATSK
jgi:hypothetical protein